jgi:lysozyme
LRSSTLSLLLAVALVPPAFAQDGLPAPAPTPTTPGAIRGIDVSVYQGNINWTKVAQSGIQFAFIRAGDGLNKDSQFATNWANAKAAGIMRGAYHFFRASHDGASQANTFLGWLGGDLGELPPIADVETLDGQSASTLGVQLQAWVQTVQGTASPGIYTAPGNWNSWNMPSFSSLTLWEAEWGVSQAKAVTGWSSWTFWQYRSDASVPGISTRVDADLYRGSSSDLQSLVNSGANPTSIPANASSSNPTSATSPSSGNPSSGAPGSGATASGGTAPASSASTGTTASSGPSASKGLISMIGNSNTNEFGDGEPILRQGADGANVKRLQQLLNSSGANLEEDGIFGPKTEAAVKQFQESHACAVDGVVGPQTWGALHSAQTPAQAAAAPAPSPSAASHVKP